MTEQRPAHGFEHGRVGVRGTGPQQQAFGKRFQDRHRGRLATRVEAVRSPLHELTLHSASRSVRRSAPQGAGGRGAILDAAGPPDLDLLRKTLRDPSCDSRPGAFARRGRQEGEEAGLPDEAAPVAVGARSGGNVSGWQGKRGRLEDSAGRGRAGRSRSKRWTTSVRQIGEASDDGRSRVVERTGPPGPERVTTKRRASEDGEVGRSIRQER